MSITKKRWALTELVGPSDRLEIKREIQQASDRMEEVMELFQSVFDEVESVYDRILCSRPLVREDW